MVARLISLPLICWQCLQIRMRIIFLCSSLALWLIVFELVFGYKWQAIYHVVYKDNSSAQVDSCCILFEYSIMHAHEGKSGTRVLTRDVPASIIRVKSFACTRSAKRGWNCTYCVCVHHHTRFSLKFKSSCTVRSCSKIMLNILTILNNCPSFLQEFSDGI